VAELLFLGRALTGTPARPEVRAVAVADGRVTALDRDALARRDVADVVEVGEGCLLPGFRDGHVHPILGGIAAAGAPVADAGTLEEVLACVRDYAGEHPEQPWIRGAGYNAALLPGGVGQASWLDDVVSDRPVALTSNDAHMLWVNTRALEAAGLSATSLDPALGTVVRDAGGAPVGMLLEWGAMALVEQVAPPRTQAELGAGLAHGLAYLASVGITWAQDAMVTPEQAEVYLSAGPLPVAVNLALLVAPGAWREQPVQFSALRERVQQAGRADLTCRTVKLFADGVVEGGTAAMLEPYADKDPADPCARGLPNWDPGDLIAAVTAFDAAGFQVHIHAIGDRGVRMALDAVEAMQRANPPWDRRPTIAHNHVVHPDDRPRYATLGVIANSEPLWAQHEPVMDALTIPRLGEQRSGWQYPLASLAGLGVRQSFGSDWPVTPADPLAGIATAVFRENAAGDVLCPHERIPFELALAAYTAGTAYQGFCDDAGTIEVGACADVTYVAADPRGLGASALATLPVLGTWSAGREVFRR